MEFEKDAPVSDEQRRLADAKKITLQPTHTDIEPEDISESEIASSHINGQPIVNLYSDNTKENIPSEKVDVTTSSNIPNVHKQSFMMIAITVGTACILIVASMFLILALIS